LVDAVSSLLAKASLPLSLDQRALLKELLVLKQRLQVRFTRNLIMLLFHFARLTSL